MFRGTVRLRLTLLCGALIFASGVILVALTYLFVADRPVAVRYLFSNQPDGGQLPAVPTPADLADRQHDATVHHLLTQGAITLGIMTVVSLGLGWLLAGRVLRPVRTITATARRISAGNLHQRLALSGPPDEFTRLGDTFDELLARLESSFTAQRRFVANAAHELRTPLTVQRAHLEAALIDPDPSAASWRRACERALAAGTQQERILDALLTLARSEGGLTRQEEFDLAEVAGEVVATADDILATAVDGPRFTCALDPASAVGDPHLARRLVTNLVDNAVRHNVAGGQVDVRTGRPGGRPTLCVANTGPDVQPADLARLLQPFQRLAPDRTGDGLGLGLSIVDAVATAHGARLTLEPRAGGGLEVTVSFPAPGPSPRAGF
ncbi:sensor histidine kinase [Virgisporangium aurantiacum]|uniref:histidine kinase n=1 Tax=Virgisporangium aurantiacum TaxID=175570 RepID=A0A8J3Z8M3_9ACTN|nr:HAMP domain-containing sensor histidine kinase [Virgisporangium aurantiacum]GIJ56903.1 sensor protein CutS [Virgisporangium aurantiacum]